MCVCNIIRYYAFWDSGNQWIRIYLDQAYTGDLGVKVVGVKKIFKPANIKQECRLEGSQLIVPLIDTKYVIPFSIEELESTFKIILQ